MSEGEYTKKIEQIDGEIEKLKEEINKNIENGLPDFGSLNQLLKLQISQLEEEKKLYLRASAMRELGKTEEEIKKMIVDYRKRKNRISIVEKTRKERKEIIRKERKK